MCVFGHQFYPVGNAREWVSSSSTNDTHAGTLELLSEFTLQCPCFTICIKSAARIRQQKWFGNGWGLIPLQSCTSCATDTYTHKLFNLTVSLRRCRWRRGQACRPPCRRRTPGRPCRRHPGPCPRASWLVARARPLLTGAPSLAAADGYPHRRRWPLPTCTWSLWKRPSAVHLARRTWCSIGCSFLLCGSDCAVRLRDLALSRRHVVTCQCHLYRPGATRSLIILLKNIIKVYFFIYEGKNKLDLFLFDILDKLLPSVTENIGFRHVQANF